MAVPLKGQLDFVLPGHSKAGMVFLSPDYAASMQRYKELGSCSGAGGILTGRLKTAAFPDSNAERNYKYIFAPPLSGNRARGAGDVGRGHTAGPSEALTPQLESR